MKQDLLNYLQRESRTRKDRLRKHTHDLVDGKKLPQRFLFKKIRSYIEDFLRGNSESRLLIIPGLRGVGKTTLMAQLCSKLIQEENDARTLFVSIEETKTLFNAGILEVMQTYEEILETDLESLKERVFVFFDEVQIDPDWAKALKILHDRTSRVFFCCTGSSAVVLQSTPDIARGRAIFERMTPMCFAEYEMIKNGVYPTVGLKDNIKQAIYFSKDAQEVYKNLYSLRRKVNEYWTKIDRRDIGRFLTFGTLPFTLSLKNESSIYDSISLLLDGIIKKDLPLLGNFDTKTLSVVKRLLLIISENDTTSLNKMEKPLGVDRLTIDSLLSSLEKAELLIRVPAYGSNMTIARKPIKYLFMSPAVRMSFFSIVGQESTFQTRKGKLLEDCVGGYLYRDFIVKGVGAFRYDSSENGADFILQILNEKQIIVETGMGKKDQKQVLNSMKKINSDYGVIFSNAELKIDEENSIISIPLDYYFLM